jgi:hypothetical protein
MAKDEPTDSWHLSKSVPITLIFGLLVQAGAIVWTVSMMMSDIEANMRDIMVLEISFNELEDVVQTQQVSLARIDENIKAIRDAVEYMMDRQRESHQQNP